MGERVRAIAVLALFGVLLGYGVVTLLLLRAGVGDAFPPYSTHRADPLGAKAIYQALGRMDGVTVSRSVDPPGTDDADTLLFIGVPVYDDINEVERDIVDALEAAAHRGARVVLAFEPILRESEVPTFPSCTACGPGGTCEPEPDDDPTDPTDPADPPDQSPEAAEPAEPEAEAEGEAKSKADEAAEEKLRKLAEDMKEELMRFMPPTVMLPERWGLRCAYNDLAMNLEGEYAPVSADLAADDPLPASIPWHSAVVFRDLSDAWRTVYRRGDDAVIVERAVGRGSLVLCGDSFLFSNEALRADRRADLMAWFAGPARTVVFDEYLKGVRRAGGIMTLARAYRLHGFFAGLAVLALLVVWRNTRGLAPAPAADMFAVHVEGRDAGAGLAAMLARHVPPREMPRVCLDTWVRSHGPGKAASPAAVSALADLAEACAQGESNAQDTYNAMCRVVEEQKRKIGQA